MHELWTLGFAADISMLLGTIVIGIGGGFAVGLWCAGRTGMRRARVVENAASILYCAPVYVVGFGTLMLFHGSFGVVPLPYFFDAAPVWASPFTSPWTGSARCSSRGWWRPRPWRRCACAWWS